MRFLPKSEIILFDLEYQDSTLCDKLGVVPEIWEVGAVRVNRFGDPQSEFSRMCRPQRLDLISGDVRMITGVSDIELETAPPVSTVCRAFEEWAGHTCLMSWGVGDYQILKQACGRWLFAYPFFDGLSFVSGLVADLDHQPKSYSLKHFLDMFGLEQQNHRALGDARCLAQLIKKVICL